MERSVILTAHTCGLVRPRTRRGRCDRTPSVGARRRRVRDPLRTAGARHRVAGGDRDALGDLLIDLRVARSGRRRGAAASALRRVQPAALGLLEGDPLAGVDPELEPALDEWLSRLAPVVTGDTRAAIAAYFESSGAVIARAGGWRTPAAMCARPPPPSSATCAASRPCCRCCRRCTIETGGDACRGGASARCSDASTWSGTLRVWMLRS
jgi:hypothetical protein